jgi:hypothetical protein
VTPPLDARVNELLVALFGRSAFEVTSEHTAEGDPDAVRACADRLRVLGFTDVTTGGTRITVRT